VIVRTTPVNEKQNQQVKKELATRLGTFKEESFETIGPTIGQETTVNAVKAIIVASVLIVLYIAWSFRKVPKPTSSWRFGIAAVLALLHDLLVLIGLFSLFGHFFHVEIDSLFITALLTVMGFSVHDTIVVFDRVRENLLKGSPLPFPETVNNSILQTIDRSLNTSLTAALVLFTLLLFGGETTKWFVIALLIGIISGTYSSIFNAAPFLVLWHEIDQRRKKNVASSK
jgi:preprotein translocase subunit SecF